MNVSELLGAVVQSGLSPSSNDRMKNSLGGGKVLDNLRGMLGDASKQGTGRSIFDAISGVLCKAGGGGGGGIADAFSGILGEAGRAVGGNRNLAVGGLGALVGALLGGGGKSIRGAVGGGVMALLAAMAFNALKGSGAKETQVPAGLLEPETVAEKQKLEQDSTLILRAMINATKADGQIDQDEVNRIAVKLDEAGIDAEGQRYVMDLMRQPMETDKLIAAAQGKPELAAQIYAASLMAIEVDTQAERDYLHQLAGGLGLAEEVTNRIRESTGMRPA